MNQPSVDRRWRGRLVLPLSLLFGAGMASAQVSTVPLSTVGERPARVLALTDARLVIRPGQVVERGTLLVRDGRIEAAGAQVRVPAGAAVIDLQGRTVFAGFIDVASRYAQPDERPQGRADGRSGGVGFQPQPQAGARHWSSLVRPERDVATTLTPDQSQARRLRALGFTSVLSVPRSGVLRGQAALVNTAASERLNEVLVAPQVAQVAAFDTSTTGEYPRSLIGAVALVRQTLHDADWQRRQLDWQARHPATERAESNLALAALKPVLDRQQPLLLVARDELDYARGDALATEFGIDVLLQGTGHEYRRAAQLRAAGRPVVVPLTFPETPAVEDPDKALDVPLEELEHWQWAPFNARVLAEAGVAFAVTADGLKKPETEFWSNLRKAVRHGLDEHAALDALTRQPARMLGVDDRLGTLEPGRQANLVVADAGLFHSDDAQIHEVWIDGRRYVLSSGLAAGDVAGTWELQWRGTSAPSQLVIEGGRTLSGRIGQTRFPVALDGRELILHPPGAVLGLADERVSLVASVDGGRLEGHALQGGADSVRVSGVRSAAAVASPPLPLSPPLPGVLRYPAGAFGRAGVPEQARVLVRGATLWTQAAQGVITNGDMLVEGGRIVGVGENLPARAGVAEIDGRGLHVTPGLIDAHSHIAVSRGINEGSHSVTSEVRIADALDPTDISIYRQLAGGVTSSLLLHGSSNTIGGQSQAIKLRWGAQAEDLVFEGSAPTIKFALGENVKQSNWGFVTGRFPQTRLGVQALLRDQFNAARAYATARSARGGAPLRRDLRLEALVEVLDGKRVVHIHSYRQDEVFAFAGLAREYGIVPVFQHVLEGYKVADELAALGAGASTFSDRWGFKVETADGNPYNPAILVRRGVLTSVNSDSAELARRLNTEAAKAVKYGGLSDVEALDLVTRNPARQLGVDARVGSLEPGKDADFVIWSAHPLSTAAVPRQTWVDGRRYFDRDTDRAEQASIEQQRARLLLLALSEQVRTPGGRGNGELSAIPATLPVNDAGAHVHVGQPETHLALYHDGSTIHVCEEEH